MNYVDIVYILGLFLVHFSLIQYVIFVRQEADKVAMQVCTGATKRLPHRKNKTHSALSGCPKNAK